MMTFDWNHFIDLAQETERQDYRSSVEEGKYIEAHQRTMDLSLEIRERLQKINGLLDKAGSTE